MSDHGLTGLLQHGPRLQMHDHDVRRNSAKIIIAELRQQRVFKQIGWRGSRHCLFRSVHYVGGHVGRSVLLLNTNAGRRGDSSMS